MGNKRTWTDEDLASAVAVSQTYRGVAVALGLSPGNKTCKRVKDRIEELGLDRSHFWHKTSGGVKRMPDSEIFTKGRLYNTNIKKRFLELVEYKCSSCGLSEWQGRALALHVDHINGDRTDNTLENLRLLCPNCHSQTETWSKRK